MSPLIGPCRYEAKNFSMKNILHIISSPMGDRSHSIKLGRAIIKQLVLKHQKSKVIERNLLADNPPYLDSLHISAFFKNEKLSYSDAIIAEIKEADFIVLGAPMYNFGVHAALKAFIDQIVRFGHTISYQEDGTKIGLLKGKIVYLAITAGGNYKNSGFDPVNDYIVNYLNTILNYIGIDTIIPFIIEGTARPDFVVDYELICSDIENAVQIN